MNERRKIAIVGATSAIAEHCARLWVQGEPVEMSLLGRDEGRLERVAKDLRTRNPSCSIRSLRAEFHDAEAIGRTVAGIFADGPVDIALIAHGVLPEQSRCQQQLGACREALEVNGVSPALYAEAFAGQMAQVNGGTLAIIGSVAGDRGRKSNYVYGSAKALLWAYVQGLQHRFAGTGVKVVLLKPGPTDTPMTAHLKAKNSKMASVESVASKIVDAIEKGRPSAYVPGKWRPIMWVVRHMPAFVFNKTNI